MKNKKIILLILIMGIVAAAALFSIKARKNENNFETRREKVLSQLYLAIEQAEIEGKYKCCIEPLCTMCYFGDWIWKDGTCDCDGMIAKGELDKVCPQCLRGIKEGRCKLEVGTCPIPEI